MKRKHLFIIVMVAIPLILTLGSCAKPPEAEINEAKSAVARAESDPDVPVYAPDSLAKAIKSLSLMNKELDAKKYDSAKTLALETTQNAENAISDAAAAKKKAKSSASALLSSVKTSLEETKKALASAKKIRGIKLSFTSADSDIEAAEIFLSAAEKDFNSGSYKTSIEKGDSAKNKLMILTKQISDAVRAASKKK